MKKILKYALLALAGVGLVVVALLAFVAATFNPNDYKPQIQQAAKEKLDRTLKIGGDIKLTFYPTLGANLGGLSLSEHASDKEFASVESVRVALQLMPLLAKKLVVSRVEVRGLRANVIRHKNGTTNLDDLLGKNKPAAKAPQAGGTEAGTPMQFDIDHVFIDDASLSYTDESTGAKFSVDIAMYSFSDADVSAALDKAVKRGVKVRFLPQCGIDWYIRPRGDRDA